MPHVNIWGLSRTGKTTLAKHLSAEMKKAGFGILLLDPKNEAGWTYDKKFESIEELAAFAWQCTDCCLFIEEGWQTIGLHPDDEIIRLSTQGAGLGLRMFISSQFPTQISRGMRIQADTVFAFNLPPDPDSKDLSTIMNEPRLKECNTLPKYQFFKSTKMELCQKMTLKNKQLMILD